MRRLSLILLFMVSLTGCVTPGIEDWPDTVPPPHLYLEAWRADATNQQIQSQEEYLFWILNYYRGTVIYPIGWLDVEDRLLARTPEEFQPALDSRLEELGIRIASEWAKKKDDRRIVTRLLSLWASTLQLMAGYEELMNAIDVIAIDIDALLAGELQKRDVTEARYAEILGFDAFGDF